MRPRKVQSAVSSLSPSRSEQIAVIATYILGSARSAYEVCALSSWQDCKAKEGRRGYKGIQEYHAYLTMTV